MLFLKTEKALEVRNTLNRMAQEGRLNGSRLHLDLTKLIQSPDSNCNGYVAINVPMAHKIACHIRGLHDHLEETTEEFDLGELDSDLSYLRTDLLGSEGQEFVQTSLATICSMDPEVINRHYGFNPENS